MDKILVTVFGVIAIAITYWFFLMNNEATSENNHDHH